MTLTCSRCKKSFREGEHILARIISIYHEVNRPHGEEFRYAIERPHAATNIQHLSCPNYSLEEEE